jgi:hypothetical protein
MTKDARRGLGSVASSEKSEKLDLDFSKFFLIQIFFVDFFYKELNFIFLSLNNVFYNRIMSLAFKIGAKLETENFPLFPPFRF